MYARSLHVPNVHIEFPSPAGRAEDMNKEHLERMKGEGSSEPRTSGLNAKGNVTERTPLYYESN